MYTLRVEKDGTKYIEPMHILVPPETEFEDIWWYLPRDVIPDSFLNMDIAEESYACRKLVIMGSTGYMYELTQYSEPSDIVTCTCMGFRMRKDCRHIHDMRYWNGSYAWRDYDEEGNLVEP